MQWSDLTAAIQNYLEAAPVGQPPTADFTAALPVIINDAELRIYRDLDFLATRGQNASLAFTAGARTLSLAAMLGQQVDGFAVAYPYPVVVEGVAAILPSGNAPQAGQRVAYTRASLDFIDMVWPAEAATAPPGFGSAWFAMRDHDTIIVAPTPDQSYAAEVTGIWRPAPMSAANPETYLGDQFSDLLFAACMVESNAFIRNFGAQADDARMAMSWEETYQRHKGAALAEEARRKGMPPPAPAQPPQPPFPGAG